MSNNELLNKLEKACKSIEETKRRSAWDKGVALYAVELLKSRNYDIECGYLSDEDFRNNRFLKTLLNGADNWTHYSMSACSLVAEEDICKRLCSPSMFKYYDKGMKVPKGFKYWAEVQGLALTQACELAWVAFEKAC